MAFEYLCRLAELVEDKPSRFEVSGVPVAVVLSDCGLHAVNDICTHAEVSLSEGEVDNCTIECWLHGSRFDLRTGAPTGLPATKPVAVYQVRVSGEGEQAIVEIEIPS